MSNGNICRFIPFHSEQQAIHTINFVLETDETLSAALRAEALYKMYYVCNGRGMLHTLGRLQPISRGDVFFTFASEQFAIEAQQDLRYMYISFLGARGNKIMEQLGIGPHNRVFSNMERVEAFWQEGLHLSESMADLTSESVLLYTFASLGKNKLTKPQAALRSTAIHSIKKYIDDHFSDAELSLDGISAALSYNKKYISTAFKKAMGVGVVEYLHTIRIQYACTMVQQGFTSVNDISLRCGFADPQYFSRVFKSKMGMAPGAYIKALRDQHT